MKRPRRPASASSPAAESRPVDTPLRIIGGKFRGSKLRYSGDPRTRPMKDRVREAVFNLVGPVIKGMQAIDLFAGTGALALESVSRGAISAIAIERHFPSVDLIRENAESLGIGDVVEVAAGDTFIWAKRMLSNEAAGIPLPTLSESPWVVYCCPPYALYESNPEDLLEMLADFYQAAPLGSCLLVEADERFDFTSLIQPERWDVRNYFPAIVGILRKDDPGSMHG